MNKTKNGIFWLFYGIKAIVDFKLNSIIKIKQKYPYQIKKFLKNQIYYQKEKIP